MGLPSCSDLAVGEAFGIAFNGLHHGDGAMSRAAVVVLEATTAADEMDILSRRVHGENVVFIVI